MEVEFARHRLDRFIDCHFSMSLGFATKTHFPCGSPRKRELLREQESSGSWRIKVNESIDK